MIIDSDKQKKRNIIIVAAVVLIILLYSFFAFGFIHFPRDISKQTDYVIEGVPYAGAFNHKGDFAYIFGADTSSAVVSILEYWNPGENNFVGVSSCFSETADLTDMEDVKSCISKFGDYNTRIEHLSVEELKKYVNDDEKTPLFLFLPFSPDQPADASLHPAVVLFGVKDLEKKVVLHDYWYGNNYEVPFDDFNRLWNKMRPDERNAYLIVQPKNLRENLREISKRTMNPYPPRTVVMEQSHFMFQNYALATAYYLNKNWEMALKYYNVIINDSKFEEYFPPYFKVLLYSRISEVYLAKGNNDQAIANVNKAIELDRDLDKPFKDWPGFDLGGNKLEYIGKAARPFNALGDIYMTQENYEKALQSYRQSIEITPRNNNRAQAGIRRAIRLGSMGDTR